ncbi:hypothetical protein D3C80_1682420 [compost metagenome]
MAFDENLEKAMQSALRHAIEMITARVGLPAIQAYSLISMAVDVRITQVVNVKKGIHVMIPKTLLQQKHKEAWDATTHHG